MRPRRKNGKNRYAATSTAIGNIRFGKKRRYAVLYASAGYATKVTELIEVATMLSPITQPLMERFPTKYPSVSTVSREKKMPMPSMASM